MTGHRSQAVVQLRQFAADAEKRHWLALALDSNLAAVQLLQADNDPAAAALRSQVESTAREHGFAWILARLPATKPQPG
jgi:predicted negative regulator of RcsB-dependent stress response